MSANTTYMTVSVCTGINEVVLLALSFSWNIDIKYEQIKILMKPLHLDTRFICIVTTKKLKFNFLLCYCTKKVM